MIPSWKASKKSLHGSTASVYDLPMNREIQKNQRKLRDFTTNPTDPRWWVLALVVLGAVGLTVCVLLVL